MKCENCKFNEKLIKRLRNENKELCNRNREFYAIKAIYQDCIKIFGNPQEILNKIKELEEENKFLKEQFKAVKE